MLDIVVTEWKFIAIEIGSFGRVEDAGIFKKIIIIIIREKHL